MNTDRSFRYVREACFQCDHTRRDHCHCGSRCMKCKCSRYRNHKGLAPCPQCDRRDGLREVPVGNGRTTYRCDPCALSNDRTDVIAGTIITVLGLFLRNQKGRKGKTQ